MFKRNPGLKTRVKTAVPLGIVIIGCLFINQYSAIAMFAFLNLLCIIELISMRPGTRWQRIALIFIGISIFSYHIGVLFNFLPFDAAVVWYQLLTASLVFSIYLVLKLFTSRIIPNNFIINLALVALYIAIPFSFAVALIMDKGFTPNLIFSILLIIWAGDIAAYFSGKNFGKHKLFEKISPNKTKEGAFGALIASILMAWIVYLIFKESTLSFWLIAGFTIWLSGLIGDLVESMIKRNAAVKDSGTFLPGHGGFLDRFDSLIFTLPFFSLLYLIFN